MSRAPRGLRLLSWSDIRRTSGQAFWDFMHARIFDPLDMNDSSYRLEDRFRGLYEDQAFYAKLK